MRPNLLRKRWEAGLPVVNGWLAVPSHFSAETMAHQGWDSLTIDMQHGVVDYQTAVSMLTAISTTDTVPIVRVPWLDAAALMKSLDAGAYGLICPMVNTREDAERLVEYTHYPPDGTRSFGPIRALLYGGADYPSHANEDLVVFAMIETRAGLDNLEDILSVPGIDGVYIGPSDLSLALGCKPTFDDVDPPVAEAIALIAAKAKEYGKVPAVHCGTPESALSRIEMGFKLVTVASDARIMAAGSQKILSSMRSELRRPDGSAY